jgi:glutaredoxin
MNKKTTIMLILGGVLIIALAVFLYFQSATSQKNLQALENQITYYYGENCPHCLRVLQFIEENKIAGKVTFTKKEIGSISNGTEFLQVAKKCGISASEAGVPLVYAEGKCFMGEIEVTDFFREKAGISQ